MHRLLTMLVILVLGGVMLAPVLVAMEPRPMPGDFTLQWDKQKYVIPVLWSLCASGGLALLYLFYRR